MFRWACIGIVSLVLGLLAACGTAAQTPGLILSEAKTPLITPTLSGPERDATKNAAIDAQKHAAETRIASGTPFAPTLIPVPTVPAVWTPTLGISYDCAQGNHQFDYGGCWTGIINNEYVFVQTGSLTADPAHGIVRVFTTTMALHYLVPMQEYRTPSPAGTLHPVQVVWPIMTLEVVGSNPPVRFGFDLAGRQWVAPPPLPAPSVTAPPTPSPSGTPTPGSTSEYSVAALNATAAAVGVRLPTASPDPHLPANKAASLQSTDLWHRAYGTAIALYPAPPGYYPPDLFRVHKRISSPDGVYYG